MRRCTLFGLCMAMIAPILLASVAAAQDRGRDPSPYPAIEITPYVALGSQGASNVGSFVSVPLSERFSFESELGYRRGEGHINALSSSANLVFTLPPARGVFPYLAAGAGLYQYGSPLVQSDGSIATQSRTTVALNAGGGVKIPVNDNMGMRTDVRWFKPIDRGASESWRLAHGVSFGRSR